MGFQAPQRTYSLEFEGDDDYDGLVIKVRPPTVGEALANLDLSWITDGSLPAPERVERETGLFTLFVSRLVSWNVETEDGVPVPTTIEGFLSLEQAFGVRIIRSWLWETSGVPRPLDSASPAGEPTEQEVSIPMEPLPVSLAS